MSRQQIHMLRKKARGICLTCGKPAIGVYCLEHTIKARERMRVRLKYQRRLKGAPSYVLQKRAQARPVKPGSKPRAKIAAKHVLSRTYYAGPWFGRRQEDEALIPSCRPRLA